MLLVLHTYSTSKTQNKDVLFIVEHFSVRCCFFQFYGVYLNGPQNYNI